LSSSTGYRAAVLHAAPALDPDARDPLWIQIAGLIEAEVAGGVLTRGSRLPSERELCERLGVSRVTLRRALSHLVDEGVLESSRGRGWYVTTGVLGEPPNMLRSFTQTAAARGLEASAHVLDARVSPATIDEADAFEIAPGADVFHLRRLRLLGGAPIAFDHARVPLEVGPGLPELDFSTASLYGALEDHGVVPTRADYSVEATAAGPDDATLLGVEPGDPLLVTSQTTFDQHDRPIELATMSYRGDRYRFRASLRRPTTRKEST
jgi:GntR family transcriptional regulator